MRREAAVQSVSSLSGDETLKLALCCLFSGESSPSILLLDEPDNHLDLNSNDLLIHALNKYKGTIILVCHDKKFAKAININQILNLSC